MIAAEGTYSYPRAILCLSVLPIANVSLHKISYVIKDMISSVLFFTNAVSNLGQLHTYIRRLPSEFLVSQ